MRKSNGFHSLVMLLLIASNAAAQLKVDPRLPDYKKAQEVTGDIVAVGDFTLSGIMTLLAEMMIEAHPKMTVQVETKGDSPSHALLTGRSSHTPVVNLMDQKFVDTFKAKWDYEPTAVIIASDMMGFAVHKDNPIAKSGLTLAQLDAIYSKARKRGHPSAITTWGDTGLEGDWKDKPIVLYGRNPASGTYGYVLRTLLDGGAFSDKLIELPGSTTSAKAVAADPNGIAFIGIGYRIDGIAFVPVAADVKSKPVPATPEHVDDYPLSRHFWMYLNHKPGTKLDPLRREFMRLIYSAQGQEQVVKDGYIPLDAQTAKKEAAKLGIELELKPKP